MEDLDKQQLLVCTTDIVSAYVAQNELESGELPGLIETVHKTLATLELSDEIVAGGIQPAVPVNRSVTDDYIICLEDGKKLKMLKRHLKTAYGMTPEDYRARWGLPADYPMVAPNYAKKRSRLAKDIGLGTKHKQA